jgi:hypothetical protein
MKHPIDTKNQFIELRASGLSVEDIIHKLGIGRATAFRWQNDAKAQINNLQVLRLEAAQARVLGPYEDRLQLAVARLQRYQAEMDGRDPKYMDMKELQTLIDDARAQLDKLTVTPAYVPEPGEATDAEQAS